jgi:hypothetical protein
LQILGNNLLEDSCFSKRIKLLHNNLKKTALKLLNQHGSVVGSRSPQPRCRVRACCYIPAPPLPPTRAFPATGFGLCIVLVPCSDMRALRGMMGWLQQNDVAIWLIT